jgi:hypothetical protein
MDGKPRAYTAMRGSHHHPGNWRGAMLLSIFFYHRTGKRFANRARLRKKPYVCPSTGRR